MDDLDRIAALITAVRRDDTAATARLLHWLDARMAPEEIGALLEMICALWPPQAAPPAPPRTLCA